MTYLNQITHRNPNIQEKVNYFADYFHFVNNKLGKIPEIQFENHLSLVTKITYQIELNLKKSTPYLTNYFSNDLLNPDKFIGRFPHASICSAQIVDYLSENDKRRVKWIKENPDFLSNLNSLRIELETSMIDEALTSLISFLRCKHKLKTHSDVIAYLTRIIVTEFRFRGHSKEDVSRIISKIMSDDLEEFPFPKNIIEQKHIENYKELKAHFISSRDFKSQFEGIKNLFEKEEETSYFVFRIFGLSMKELEKTEIEYDNIVFH